MYQISDSDKEEDKQDKKGEKKKSGWTSCDIITMYEYMYVCIQKGEK